MKTIKVLILTLILSIAAVFLNGCKNIHEYEHIVTEDHINKITVTTFIYRDDTSFSIGTVGNGSYQLFSVNGVGF